MKSYFFKSSCVKTSRKTINIYIMNQKDVVEAVAV